jgi:acyl-CoA reductase-like NAD-dependent aldehyde dehydrogenase
MKAQSGEDAIRLANDSEYGLTASIFTADVSKGLKMAARIRTGMCHINGPTIQDEPQVPFGGVGASGYGRFGSEAGIDGFTELRWITVQTEKGHFPF